MMLPSDILIKLLGVDRTTGRFLLAGLGVLAAAAIAASWNFGPDMVLAGLYVLGFALSVTVLAFIARNGAMRRWLGWTLIAFFTIYMAGLVDSAAQISGRLPSPPCYLRIFVEPPNACEQRLGPTVAVVEGPRSTKETSETKGDDSAAEAVPPDHGLPRSYPELSKVESGNADPLGPAIGEPDDSPPGPFPRSDAGLPPTYTDGPIFLQFGDKVTREQSAALSAAISAAGWAPVGGDKGGEEIAEMPRDNEVRYFDAASRDAAVDLAEAIAANAPGTKIDVRDLSRLYPKTPPGLLEIWVSDLRPTP